MIDSHSSHHASPTHPPATRITEPRAVRTLYKSGSSAAATATSPPASVSACKHLDRENPNASSGAICASVNPPPLPTVPLLVGGAAAVPAASAGRAAPKPARLRGANMAPLPPLRVLEGVPAAAGAALPAGGAAGRVEPTGGTGAAAAAARPPALAPPPPNVNDSGAITPPGRAPLLAVDGLPLALLAAAVPDDADELEEPLACAGGVAIMEPLPGGRAAAGAGAAAAAGPGAVPAPPVAADAPPVAGCVALPSMRSSPLSPPSTPFGMSASPRNGTTTSLSPSCSLSTDALRSMQHWNRFSMSRPSKQSMSFWSSTVKVQEK